MDIKIVHQFAGKLGLLEESNIIEKTTELLRLLYLKGSSLPQLGDYARCVICLDLATSLYGHEFDTQTAMKLSGFKKPGYLNHRRICEKLLDLCKPIGIPEICVQLGLTEIQEACRSILEKFVNSSENGMRNIDTTHPQYASMAVYQVCRLKRIRIQKTKLISYSHLKANQWAMLEKSWESWAKANADQLREFQMTGKGLLKLDSVEEGGATGSAAKKSATTPITEQPQLIEEFEDWRKRVLERAFEDLEKQRTVKLH